MWDTWGLHNNKDEMWAKLLMAKYIRHSGRDVPHSSHVWRSIKQAVNLVICKGFGWRLGNGTQIRFWKDTWVGDTPIMDSHQDPITSDDMNCCARDYWKAGVGWDWDAIGPNLSETCRLGLLALAVDEGRDNDDHPRWIPSANGDFSISSAYQLLINEDISQGLDTNFYNVIWKLQVPERIRAFIWTLAKGRILNNVERRRRHLTNDDSCLLCGADAETCEHLFRDCPQVICNWRLLGLPSRHNDSLNQCFAVWLRDNITSNDYLEGVGQWSAVFATTLWWIWRWRNDFVFARSSFGGDAKGFILGKVREYKSVWDKRKRVALTRERVETMVVWRRPPESWIKLNTDGARRNDGRSAAGGVLRDHHGIWKAGFVHNIGTCSVPSAELWDLKLAWDLGFRKIVVESDSQLAITLSRRPPGRSHPLFSLAHLCHGFLLRDWSIQLTHVFREANVIADSLATLAFSFPFGLHCFPDPPVGFVSLLDFDLSWLATPRLVIA